MKGECTYINILIAGANGTTGKKLIGELSKKSANDCIRDDPERGTGSNDKRTRRTSNPCRFRGKCG